MEAANEQGETSLPSAVSTSEADGGAAPPLKLQFEVALPQELGGELRAWRKTFERFTDVLERYLESSLTRPSLPAPPMPWTAPPLRPTEQSASRPPVRVESLPPPEETIPFPALRDRPSASLPAEEMPVLVEEASSFQRTTQAPPASTKTVDPVQTAEVCSAEETAESNEPATAQESAERHRAAALVQRGEGYRAAGRKDKALACYQEALTLDVDCIPAYFGRASIYIDQGRFNEALFDCNWALQREPERAVFYVLRGLAYVKLGNSKRALEEADEALRFDPLLHSAYVLRGSTRFKTGMGQEALADLKEAIRLRPHDVKVHQELGRVLTHLGKHLLAARAYAKVLELSPNAHEARYLRGVALRQGGEAADAEEEFAEFLRHCPQTAPAHYERGLCRLQQRHYAEALADFDAVLALKPDDEAARKGRELALNKGKPPKVNAATDATVESCAEKGETASAPVPAAARSEPAPTQAGQEDRAREQRLAKEKLEREKAAQRARAAQRPARKKTRFDSDDEEHSPWVRRIALAAAVLVMGYFFVPMVWSFVSGYSLSRKEDIPAAEAKVSAAELWNRFRSDAASAQSEFGQKLLEVQGIVQEVKQAPSAQKDAVQILLVGDWNGGRIACTLAPTKSASQGVLLSRVDKFGSVKLVGKCTGQSDKTVNLEEVRLIEVRTR